MNNAIDLRSDTVTRPSDAMRDAVAAAPVGDDQYGEDPSVDLLQARIADLLGKGRRLIAPWRGALVTTLRRTPRDSSTRP